MTYDLLKAFEYEVAAHRAVDHQNVMKLYDVEVVQKSSYKEARMVLEYYKVTIICMSDAVLQQYISPGCYILIITVLIKL